MGASLRKDINQMRALDRALRFARARLSGDVTAQRLLILIAVYLNEGLSQTELLRRLESTSITALSRNIADLSSLTTRKEAGPGLLELRTDPMNLRIKRVFLTRRGKAFLRQWLQAMYKTESSATRRQPVRN